MQPRKPKPQPPYGRKTQRPGDEDLKHDPKWQVPMAFGLPWGPNSDDWLTHAMAVDESMPETELQALMEAPPGYEPKRSRQEHAAMADMVLEALEALSDDDRELVQAVVFERLSFGQCAERFGFTSRTQAFRRWRQIRGDLQVVLGPLVDVDPFEEGVT